jgi:hypothetical protein
MIKESVPLTAEEILKDNMSENLWTFICSYPVAFQSDKMLKDWIIDAMEEYASKFIKCDVCGCYPSVIIKTQFGTFCQLHAKYV